MLIVLNTPLSIRCTVITCLPPRVYLQLHTLHDLPETFLPGDVTILTLNAPLTRARPVYNTVANELRSTICELEVLKFLDHMRSHSVKTD
jgi:hypothetical protein